MALLRKKCKRKPRCALPRVLLYNKIRQVPEWIKEKASLGVIHQFYVESVDSMCSSGRGSHLSMAPTILE